MHIITSLLGDLVNVKSWVWLLTEAAVSPPKAVKHFHSCHATPTLHRRIWAVYSGSEKGSFGKEVFQKSHFSRGFREFRDSGARGRLHEPPQTFTDTSPAMEKRMPWWMSLFACLSLCFSRAKVGDRNDKIKKAEGRMQTRNLLPATVGGGRRWKTRRRDHVSPQQGADEEEHFPMMAPTWQLKQAWDSLQKRRGGGFAEEMSPGQPVFMALEAEAVAASYLLFGIGLLASRRRKRPSFQKEEDEQDVECKEVERSSVVVGHATRTEHSALRPIAASAMRSMQIKEVRGDGNCYWRALGLTIGISWITRTF